MHVLNVRHKGLRRFVTRDDASGLPADFVEKIRNIVSFLQEMESADELKSIVGMAGAPTLRRPEGGLESNGDPQLEITFRIDASEKAIIDLDYEDYH